MVHNAPLKLLTKYYSSHFPQKCCSFVEQKIAPISKNCRDMRRRGNRVSGEFINNIAWWVVQERFNLNHPRENEILYFELAQFGGSRLGRLRSVRDGTSANAYRRDAWEYEISKSQYVIIFPKLFPFFHSLFFSLSGLSPYHTDITSIIIIL